MTKALIVDDHPFIRSALKAFLAKEKIEILAEASNGPEGLQLARELSPDLIILDISMPQLDGMEVIRRLGVFGVKAKILIFTSLPPEIYAMRCMQAGAAGFISKNDDLQNFAKALQALEAGYSFFPHLARSSVCRPKTSPSDAEMIASLSDRELFILQKLSQGYSNKDISESILLSNKSISAYKTKILEKLNLTSVVALAEFAKRNNLI